jgi:hypothetical protein
MYTRHEESSAAIHASPEQIFARLDDQTRLSAHMSNRSWKMGWGKMETVLDAEHGQALGSHIVLRGRVFGIRLYLDEIVTLRDPPLRKMCGRLSASRDCWSLVLTAWGST